MPWGSSLFPLLIVTSSGKFTGLFVYSPSPGAGKLIASITAAAGTDPFGNAFLAGITTYNSASASNPGVIAELNNGAAQFSDPLSVDPEIFVGGIGRLHAASGGAVPITFINSSADDAAGSHSAIWLTGQPLGGAIVQAINLFASTAAGAILTNTIVNILGSLVFGTTAGGLPVTTGPLSILHPSGDVTGAKDVANINAQLANGPGTTVKLMPGQWYLNATVTLGLNQYLHGSGRSATQINLAAAAGAVPAVKIFTASGGNTTQFAGVRDLTIDGTSATAGAIGLQCGDINQVALWDVACNNFTGTLPATPSTGFYFVNQNHWTEQLHGSIYSLNCDKCLVFDVAGGTNSFERMSLDAWIAPKGGTGSIGMQWKNGAQTLQHRLALRGNMPNPGGIGISMDANCSITKGQFDVGIELDATSGTGPQTINFVSPTTSLIQYNYGLIEFLQVPGAVPWVASNASGQNILGYNGGIFGDSTLSGITTASLNAGFAAFGAGYATPGFQYEEQMGGRVRLTGMVSLTANQVAAAAIFTLPGNLKPAFNHLFTTASTLSGGGAGGTINVTSGGVVQIFPAGTNGNYVSLDGITFPLN